MISFLKKFFGYAVYNGEYKQFEDGLGEGAFSDYRHFLWIIFAIFFCIFCYYFFKNKKDLGKKSIFILSVYLLSVRVTNQSIRAIIGAEDPALRAIPFHLCTVMSFLLPLVVLFKWNKIKNPVYIVSIMGGMITIIIGDYFGNKFMTFGTVEGIIAHSLLIFIPIIDICSGNYEISKKESLKVFPLMIILILWAMLANEVFFKSYNTNYMFLKRNGLPGNIGGNFYFLIYVGIFFLFYFIIIFFKDFLNLFNKKNVK